MLLGVTVDFWLINGDDDADDDDDDDDDEDAAFAYL